MTKVASDLCGVHAQVMSSAELTLFARVDGLRRDDVSNALWKRKQLVKTWAMRGTLHLLAADEYPLWLAALSTYSHPYRPSTLKYYDMTADELDQLTAAIGTALRRRAMTREELAGAVTRATGSSKLGELARASWGSMLKPASFTGNLCFAPSAGRNVRLIHPEKWLGRRLEKQDPQESLAEIAGKFVHLQGAITREELSRWWAGMSPAGADRLLKSLGDDVTTVDIDGSRGWAARAHAEDITSVSSPKSVNLLPAFDQFVVTASARWADLTPGPVRERIYRKAAWLSPVLLVDGRMDGIWRHERKGKTLRVTIEPFVKLPAWAKKRAEEEAQRLETFLGGNLSLTWGPVTLKSSRRFADS